GGEPVLLLHGEPSWSFLYRTVMPVLAEAGFRAIAPDLIGFGRSDKPAAVGDHSYAQHVEWGRALALHQLDLRRLTPVRPGWGCGWPPSTRTASPGWWRRTPGCPPGTRPCPRSG